MRGKRARLRSHSLQTTHNSGISAAAWCEAGGAQPGLNNSVLQGMRCFSIVRRHVTRDQGVAPVLLENSRGALLKPRQMKIASVAAEQTP